MMTQENSQVEIYQFHILLLGISPVIWRRILVRSDMTISDLHYILQTAMGWEDEHLHRFHLRGRDYGIYRGGGFSFRDDPTQIRLGDFKLRLKERFIYQYDFTSNWQHQVRLEQILRANPKKTYPVCIDGARKAPEEDSGGPGYLSKPKGKLLASINNNLAASCLAN
jgi:hypothetical protein